MNALHPASESCDERFADLDAASPEAVLETLWESQLAAVAAVRPTLAAIAAASRAAAARLATGGRLVYTGAGTAGRIAAQDGAELGPTFGWPATRLLLLPAGGKESLIQAIENAEDDCVAAEHAAHHHSLGVTDVVIGVAASGTTAYTVTLLEAAQRRGALTIGLANSPGTPLLAAAVHPLLVETGAEVIAGSTRLSAGTAQKVVLNLFSTSLMMLLNRVYRGRMVDLEISNAKLRRRALGIIIALSGAAPNEAARLLAAANGNVKRALLIAEGLAADEAAQLLSRHSGNLRAALAALNAART